MAPIGLEPIVSYYEVTVFYTVACGATRENRTRILGLEGRYSAVELLPHSLFSGERADFADIVLLYAIFLYARLPSVFILTEAKPQALRSARALPAHFALRRKTKSEI